MRSITIYIIAFILLCPVMMLGQDAFKYQAVARDSMGNTIANQLIGIQISIILNDENDPPIYTEMHQPQSNNYGIINLNVGDGIPTLGDFSTINWSQKAFIQVEMDITGGTNYTISSLSEILSVPRALYAERSGSSNEAKFGLNVRDFGAVGDGTTDDSDAFLAALDSAAVNGSIVYMPVGIYRIKKTLEIEDGVSIVGEGAGGDPLQTPFNGSLIRYEGTKTAIKLKGHNSQVKDFVVRDHGGQATCGIKIIANGRMVESAHFFNVLISGFVNGKAIHLKAVNGGGIAYTTFYHVRVRHGKVAIEIDADETSYVNSNSWYHCQISGGGFDYGVKVDGGNNNVFQEMIIEPPSTTYGHLYVTKGEVYGHEMRIEGTNQSPTTPLIFFHRRTKNSTITGLYAGGLTLDKGNNFIEMKSGKAIHYRNSSFNRFKNAVFFSPDSSNIQDWDLTGNVTLQILPPSLSEKGNVLKITVPAGVIMRLEPSALARPEVKELPLYDQVNFGYHVKVNKPGIAYTATNAPKGWAASTAHSGSDEWEFVGMNAEVNRAQPSRFRLEVNNTTGAAVDVYVTTPTLSFGNQLPTIDESPLFASGGQLTGQLTHAMATVTTPGNGFLTLPLSANYFEITNTQTISRINHLTADRVPKGTVITLLFNQSGTNVSNSGYLLLKGGFTSVTNSSLTLISNGNGTWREVNRNN